MKHKLTLVLLSFFLGVQCMVAQQMKVTGVVINEDDGEPVIGASIVVKGTTIGTITDLDGKFELETQKDFLCRFTDSRNYSSAKHENCSFFRFSSYR